MRLVATISVESGVKIAKPIYSEHGKVLVNKGVELNDRLINRLLELGVSYLYIDDVVTEDIFINDSISDNLRKEASQTIENTFLDLQNSKLLSNSFVIEKASSRFSKLIRHFMSEIKSNKDLLSLISDVFVYDNYIFSHSISVTLYSLAIGMELNLTVKELEILGLGAILHDVGKMKIPTEILLKPGKLTKEEFEEVKKHPEEGFQLLKKVSTIPLVVAHCAYQHHERMDGTGYPRGIKGCQIHQFGKIIAVADVFDAVTSNRVYRQAMLPHEGLDILYAGSGTLFDKEIIEAFRKAVAIYPVGITVELSDGNKGIVTKQNVGFSERPIVRILEENGQKVHPYELDLKKELSVVIIGCDVIFKKTLQKK